MCILISKSGDTTPPLTQFPSQSGLFQNMTLGLIFPNVYLTIQNVTDTNMNYNKKTKCIL